MMDLSRRRFLQASVLASGALLLPSTSLAVKRRALPLANGLFPICQGMTNRDSTQITLVLPAIRSYSLRALSLLQQEMPLELLQQVTDPTQQKTVYKIKISGLTLSDSYRLQVIENATGQVKDERDFKALDIDKPSLQFGLVSCANDYFEGDRIKMWRVVAQQNPELLIFVGDTTYADNNSDGLSDHSGGWNNFWERYLDGFDRLSIYRLKKLIPTLATWDDHDFGADRGDSTFAESSITNFLFELFWGQQPVAGYEKGPGVSAVLNMAGQRFFLLDNRSFRTSRHQRNLSHWGITMDDFLLDRLPRSQTPAWLIAGSQFFGGYMSADSYEAENPQSLQTMLKKISQVEAPVIFASGDVHFSEVMRLERQLLGYTTYELTSSSIHSYTFPGQHLRKRNHRRIEATSAHNFLMVNSQAIQPGRLDFRCRAVTDNDDSQFVVSGRVVRG